MDLIRVAPQVLIGPSSALAAQAPALAARGAFRALRVHSAAGEAEGDGAGAAGGLPCEEALLTGGAGRPLAAELAGAARALELALRGAPGVLPRDDVAPGDSSEDEMEKGEGVRMRVRVSRRGDEKWGVKWHKNIFQQSHRLVVDEIAEDSALALWNERQPAHLQVRYGSRLMRINGVRTDALPPAQVAAKMRAELQKEEMRALFWRPGDRDASVEDAPASGLRLPGSVFVCASAELAPAAAVAAAHRLLYGPAGCAAGVEAVLDELGEEAASLLRQPSAEQLRGALGEVRAADLVAPAAASGESAAALEGSQAEGACPDREGSGALPAHAEGRAAEAPAQAVAGVAPAGADDEAAAQLRGGGGPQPDGSEEGGQLCERRPPLGVAPGDAVVPNVAQAPSWVYSCRKCGTGLFSDANVLPHSADGPRKASRDWLPAEAAQGGEATCTSVFVEPMHWMGCLDEQTGKLGCGNGACRQKLGSYSWHGLPCSCGQWQSPAFQIHCARLDCMPAGRRVRGPPPRAVFEG